MDILNSGSKYLKLIPVYENKTGIKKYREPQDKTKYLIQLESSDLPEYFDKIYKNLS